MAKKRLGRLSALVPNPIKRKFLTKAPDNNNEVSPRTKSDDVSSNVDYEKVVTTPKSLSWPLRKSGSDESTTHTKNSILATSTGSVMNEERGWIDLPTDFSGESSDEVSND